MSCSRRLLASGIVRGDPDLIIQPPPPQVEEESEEAPTYPRRPADGRAGTGYRAWRRRGRCTERCANTRPCRCHLGHPGRLAEWRRQSLGQFPGRRVGARVVAVVARMGGHQSGRSALRYARGRAGDRAGPAARPGPMKTPADQIALPLDWPQAQDDSRFILSEANRSAFDHFRNWSLWPVKATMLTGPRRSGRSLLARAFVARVKGRLFDAAERHDEAELFHAWNAAQDSGHPIVMIVDEVPPAWEVALPDLRTRLAITPMARIEQPDDALFRSVIRLLFADRGLHIPDEGAEVYRRTGRAQLFDGRAGGRGDRPLCHCRARPVDAADDPARAGRGRHHRHQGSGMTVQGEKIQAAPAQAVQPRAELARVQSACAGRSHQCGPPSAWSAFASFRFRETTSTNSSWSAWRA